MVEIKITGDTPMEALASLTAFGLRYPVRLRVVAAAAPYPGRRTEQRRVKIGAEAVTPTPGTPTWGPGCRQLEREPPELSGGRTTH